MVRTLQESCSRVGGGCAASGWQREGGCSGCYRERAACTKVWRTGLSNYQTFSAGKKSGKPKDYQGPRDAAGIIEYGLRTPDEAGVPINTPQLVSPKGSRETVPPLRSV